MSLVDYASSSDDEASEPNNNPADITGKKSSPQQPPNQPSQPPLSQTKMASADRAYAASSSAVPPRSSVEKLPDASLLLNSSALPVATGNDHASWVASAVAENASRKRDLNLLPSAPRGKIPRSTLPHTKTVPETGDGMLLPPQLRGRSNVVTEDISKLFVRKHSDHHPRGARD